MQVYSFNTLDSTQAEAKRQIQLKKIAEICVVVSKTQTAGYGRYKRPFYSPENGLYMTFILPAKDVLCPPTIVTHATAVGLVSVLTNLGYQAVSIKWINDLYVKNRKIAGILVEQIVQEGELYYLIGIGLNLNAQTIPIDLKTKMGTLKNETYVEPLSLVPKICETLKGLITCDAEDILNHYRQNCFVIGRQIIAQSGHEILKGIVSGIDDQGGLILQTDHGQRLIHTGELVKVTLQENEG